MTENFTDFESLFRSIVDITGNQTNQKVGLFILETSFERFSITVFPHIICKHKSRLRVNNRSIGKPFLPPKFEGISSYGHRKHEIEPQNRVSCKTFGKTPKLSDGNLSNSCRSTPVDGPVAGDKDIFDQGTTERVYRRNFAQMERE